MAWILLRPSNYKQAAPLVRTGGSRHAGLAALQHRNIQAAMQPLLPSVYETSPNTFRTYEIAALPYVLYKSCKYSVPRSYAFKTVRYKVVSGKIHIYDEQLNYICSHNLSERKGSINQLPEHRKQESGDWI